VPPTDKAALTKDIDRSIVSSITNPISKTLEPIKNISGISHITQILNKNRFKDQSTCNANATDAFSPTSIKAQT